MLYRQLAEVSAYVTATPHQLPEILQMLCIKAMSSLRTDALVYIELDQSGVAVPHSSFGIEVVDKVGNTPTFAISERTPFTDAIRENKVIWIDSLPQWPKHYSTMTSIALPREFKTLITCPVDAGGLPVGCLSALSHTRVEYQDESAQYFEAISIILANAILSQRSFLSNNHSSSTKYRLSNNHNENNSLNGNDYNQPLTERQNLILKLIAEGRTNAAIADVLGYSESLIRQETIKIYAKLGCSGRNEAAQIYNKLHSPAKGVAV